jgi:predicted HAD superfamily Cof-like phosphohydrolase
MDKIDSLNMVAEFHTTFNAPVLETPQIPSRQRCELRVSLLQEELDELKKAIHDNDIVEIADALCDLQYVLSGAVLEFGLGKKFPSLFSEVQRSNMSKACDDEDQAKETVEFYAVRGEESFYEKSGEKYNVHRASDHKVLKSKFYSPADLKTIIEQQ